MKDTGAFYKKEGAYNRWSGLSWSFLRCILAALGIQHQIMNQLRQQLSLYFQDVLTTHAYKASILNGQSVVRYTGVFSSYSLLPLEDTSPSCPGVLVIVKPVGGLHISSTITLICAYSQLV